MIRKEGVPPAEKLISLINIEAKEEIKNQIWTKVIKKDELDKHEQDVNILSYKDNEDNTLTITTLSKTKSYTGFKQTEPREEDVYSIALLDIKNEFFKFFKSLQTIFEMYVLSYNENFDDEFLKASTRRHKLMTQLIEILYKEKKNKLDKEKIKFYNDELSYYDMDKKDSDRFKKIEVSGKQTIISIINNFELFRKNLITIAFKNFKPAKDSYIDVFNNCAATHHNKTGDNRYINARETEAILTKNLKLIENEKKLTTVEKLMYKIDTNDEKISDKYNRSYKAYIIYREIRNMLTHRKNSTDEIFYKSIKSSTPAKMYQPENKFYEYFDLLLDQRMKYNEIGKELKFDPHRLSILVTELLNLSFIYCFSLIKENVFYSEIANIYNDMLVDYSENNIESSYAQFFSINIFDQFTDINKVDDLVFLVNSILVFEMMIKHYGDKKQSKKLEDKIELYLKRIKEIDSKQDIYDIIKAYLSKSSDRLVKLTEKTDIYLKNANKKKSELKDWYIFKILKNEFYIKKYLKE